MVSCNDLMNLSIFKNIKLIAGERGIYKNISWPYICQILDFSPWVNGGELMFLTGIGMDINDDKIMKLIYNCSEKDISGLVILTGSDGISCISESVKKAADDIKLPIFEMPWNLKLIDVTKDISNYIMKVTFNENKEREFLKSIIFSENLNRNHIVTLMNEIGFHLGKLYFIACFKIEEASKKESGHIDYMMNMIKHRMEREKLKFILDFYEDNIVCFIESENRESFNKEKVILKDIKENILTDNASVLGFGGLCYDIFNVHQSYKEALKVIKLNRCNQWKNEIIDYEDVGFYKVLFEVNDNYKLKRYCDETLGTILDNDKNYDLLYTLRVYLMNDCNLINTSKEMFIHRNTLIYRLSKIKMMIKGSLENPVFKNELVNAIMIYDYLQCEETI